MQILFEIEVTTIRQKGEGAIGSWSLTMIAAVCGGAD